MRKRYRVLVLAAFVAALVVPVGYALSLEPQPPAPTLGRTSLSNTVSAAVVAAPIVVHANAAAIARGIPSSSPLDAIPDAGKLLLAGTVLFGLSALVRKAT